MTAPQQPQRPPQLADTTPHRYDAARAGTIETEWQARWDRERTFVTSNPGQPGFDSTKPKFYCLDMFPYPSGAGLHVGHPEGYTATDIICRYKRMKGFNVLHPMGWDAFGLPAEQYAVQTGVHPAKTTRQAIETFRRQLQRFGFSYDWSREFATIDTDYYKWTQWIFLRLYHSWYDPAADRARPIAELEAALERGGLAITPSGEVVESDHTATPLLGERVGVRMWHELTQRERRAFIDDQRLAYVGEQTVNWCPKLGTVLANEEVIDGRSERGGHPVHRRSLKQWMLRITAYADRLAQDAASLDWPESTRTMQVEWIGRSEGAEIEFDLTSWVPRPSGAALSTAQGHHPRNALREVAALLASDASHPLRPVGFVARDPYPEQSHGPALDLIRTQRRLPHLAMPDATYFVTWKATEGVALDHAERDTVLSALEYFDGERCRVYAATVMSNHVHWVVRPFRGHTLAELVTSVKRFSSSQINTQRRRQGHVWDPECFDHIIRSNDYFNGFVEYMLKNPVEAGVVVNPAGYRWTFVHADAIGPSPGAPSIEEERSEEAGNAEGMDRAKTAAEGRGTQETRSLRVYTTRPDTIFGATYMVIAPEHPLVDEILDGPDAAPTGADLDAIGRYVQAARARADVDRMADAKEKTGVFSGLYAVNPATNEPIPVWIADYVLMGYGHGAIMAVPAHDERDAAFAERFGLPTRDVVYTRSALAMSHFARHASDEMGAANRWIVALADFLGLVTSESTEPAGFDAAISRIASRRASEPDPATCQIDPSTCAQELPDSVGQRRGVTRVTWLDAIETLGFSSFEQLRERFARAAFHRAAGPFAGTGFAVNSASSELSIDGLSTRDAKDAVIAWLERTGIGRRRVNFKLRDWLFSRQRYWGEPFPVVFDEHGDHHAVGDAALPVVLPDLKEFRPPESDDPAPMLAAATDWLATTAGAAGVPDLAPEAPVRREANTMPNWAGSCWYYLRFCDPKNAAQFASPEALAYWMGSTGIDLYIGGSEHAVLHLLYARFWHKVLFDLGLVPCPEPAAKLFHQGMITSFAYQRPDKSLVPADHVHLMVCENPEDMPEPDWSNWPQPQKLLKPLRMRVDSVGQWVGWKVKSHDILLINAGNLKRLREHGGSFYFETGAPGTPLEQIVERELEPREQTVAKMSKTLKNVINPDDVIAEFGADTMRLYEMAMGPLEASKPWNPRDIVGCYRFLQKAWRLIVDEQSGAPRPHAPTADSAVEKALHRLIAKVGPDIERLSFNTAIAAMMEFIKVPGPDGLTLDQAERFVLVLAPFAPHLAEELWSKLGHAKSLAHEPWPAHDPAMLRESTIEIAVQIMGKVRGHITVAADADQATVEKAALAEPRVRELIEGKTIRKVIVVPGKLVNIVAG